MNYKPLPVGLDNFEKLITRGYYYVDKTLFIKELIDYKSDINLFTRPRRFGKTLNMSMLQYFFEDARDDKGNKVDNSYLFDGLKIMDAGEKYLSYIGQHPVINLTLKEANQPDFDMAFYYIKSAIADEYRRHSYIVNEMSDDNEKDLFKSIMYREADKVAYGESLKLLSKFLEKYYGKKPIILIDEYDVPLERAHRSGYYAEMVDFMRTWFSAALKTNSSLEFAVITGCLRISKESIFTGMNNLDVISILNDKYSEHFGFTDDEVKKMCEDTGIPDNYEIVKSWYDGYVFGESNIYNPWSVVKYMSDHADYPNAFPQAYWANTSSNSIVRELIDMADEDTKQEIELLISGESVEKPVHEDITYDEIYQSMDNLWNFMFFTGYFKKIGERSDENDTTYLTLCIPNREVRYIFNNKIKNWFDEKIKARDMSVLHNAVINKDTATLENELNDILMETISYMDANESYYHGIMAGLLLGTPGYYSKSNREGGRGRSDLMFIPKSRRKEAFIFEFKKADNIRGLNAAADEALNQIDKNNYKAELQSDGYDIISSYGIAFYGKDCLVKWKE